MATNYLVLYNKGQVQSQFNNGVKTQVASAAAAKKDEHLLGAEAISITGPLAHYNAIEVEAENEQAAAGAVVRFLGATESEPEFLIFAVSNAVKKKGRG